VTSPWSSRRQTRYSCPCGWTALTLAVYNNHKAVVRLLLKRDDVYVNELSFAVDRGHETMLQVLRALKFVMTVGHDMLIRRALGCDDAAHVQACMVQIGILVGQRAYHQARCLLLELPLQSPVVVRTLTI
jgi:hypothetical protein